MFVPRGDILRGSVQSPVNKTLEKDCGGGGGGGGGVGVSPDKSGSHSKPSMLPLLR